MMKRNLLFSVPILAFLLSIVWNRYPDQFPALPEPLAIWLVQRFRIHDGEQLADLEFIVTFGISLILVSCLFWLSRGILKKWRNRD